MPCGSKNCDVVIIAESDECLACTVQTSRQLRFLQDGNSLTQSSAVVFEIRSKTPLNEAVVLSNLDSNITNANDELADDGTTFRINSQYSVATAVPSISPSTLEPTISIDTPKPFAEKPKPTTRPTFDKTTNKPTHTVISGKAGKSENSNKSVGKSGKSDISSKSGKAVSNEKSAKSSSKHHYQNSAVNKKRIKKQKKEKDKLLLSAQKKSHASIFANKSNDRENGTNLTKREKKSMLKDKTAEIETPEKKEITKLIKSEQSGRSHEWAQLTKKEKKALLKQTSDLR